MPKAVLVVDNDGLLLRTLGHMLSGEFVVTTVGSVDEAVDFLGRQDFAAVVADLELEDPNRSGAWVLEQARRHLPAARLVLISGHHIADEEARFADEVLHKPFSRPDLIAAVRPR